MRLFVALPLPEPARAALWAWSAELDGAVWRRIAPESLHVTLAFLGTRPDEDVEAVRAALGTVAGRDALSLVCGAVVALPPRRPRVLAIGVAEAGGADALGALQADVAAALVAAGVLAPERRRFRPHVTVARARRGADARVPETAPPAIAFAGMEVVLYASTPAPGGSRYDRMASVALAAG